MIMLDGEVMSSTIELDDGAGSWMVMGFYQDCSAAGAACDMRVTAGGKVCFIDWAQLKCNEFFSLLSSILILED